MKLTEATTLPPRSGQTRWDWPKMAAVVGRVWKLSIADNDYQAGEEKLVAQSARAWCKRRPHLTVRIVTIKQGAEVHVLFETASVA